MISIFYVNDLVARISPGEGDIQVQRQSDVNWLQASLAHYLGRLREFHQLTVAHEC